jgi:predicted N-acetyltransferase YhbS
MESDYEEIVRSGCMWIAEDGGEVVGLIVIHDAGDHLLLDNVAVSPTAQGRGVGSRLLAFAEEVAVRRGNERICLYTNAAMTENLDYYLNRGYTATHRAQQAGFHRVFFEKRLGQAMSSAGVPGPSPRPCDRPHPRRAP